MGVNDERGAILADESLHGLKLCHALAEHADRWLAGLLGDEPDVALVAVGGYGRSELAPGSDLDVLLVHRGRRDIDEIAQRIWYPIWEAGIPLDHGVKTVDEALAVADDDLRAALGLLDARTVAGDPALGDTARRAARSPTGSASTSAACARSPTPPWRAITTTATSRSCSSRS